MPESIVSGPTEDGAAIAVVVLVTQEAIGVTQFSSPGRLYVLVPLFSHSEVTLNCDPADQTLRVVCKSQQCRLLLVNTLIKARCSDEQVHEVVTLGYCQVMTLIQFVY